MRTSTLSVRSKTGHHRPLEAQAIEYQGKNIPPLGCAENISYWTLTALYIAGYCKPINAQETRPKSAARAQDTTGDSQYILKLR